MWEGLSLPHDTKFGNCRCKIVDSRSFHSWSLIHGLRWSGLIKVGPGCDLHHVTQGNNWWLVVTFLAWRETITRQQTKAIWTYCLRTIGQLGGCAQCNVITWLTLRNAVLDNLEFIRIGGNENNQGTFTMSSRNWMSRARADEKTNIIHMCIVVIVLCFTWTRFELDKYFLYIICIL